MATAETPSPTARLRTNRATLLLIFWDMLSPPCLHEAYRLLCIDGNASRAHGHVSILKYKCMCVQNSKHRRVLSPDKPSVCLRRRHELRSDFTLSHALETFVTVVIHLLMNEDFCHMPTLSPALKSALS